MLKIKFYIFFSLLLLLISGPAPSKRKVKVFPPTVVLVLGRHLPKEINEDCYKNFMFIYILDAG